MAVKKVVFVKDMDTEQREALWKHLNVPGVMGGAFMRADTWFLEANAWGGHYVTHDNEGYALMKLAEGPKKYQLVYVNVTARTGFDIEEIRPEPTIIVDGMQYRLVGPAAKE